MVLVVVALVLFWFLFASEIKNHGYGTGLMILRYEGRKIRHPLGHCYSVSSLLVCILNK